MIDIIAERIEYYRNRTLSALDRDDSVNALKNRAVQRELEELLAKMQSTEIRESVSGALYTTKEAAALLGVHPSTLTRKAERLKGLKIKGEWHFPRGVIDGYIGMYSHYKKRGRKPGER